MANGWGECHIGPEERIRAGDWTPAIWRSPELSEAASWNLRNEGLIAVYGTSQQGIFPKNHWRRHTSKCYLNFAQSTIG